MKAFSHTLLPLRAALGLYLCMGMGMATIASAQGDNGLRSQADALFDKGEYAKAYPLYSQLVSLSPQDHALNYRFGACTLYGGDDKAKAIGYLEFAVKDPSTDKLARYFLGRAYQLDYRFDDAITAYQHFRGTADKKLLERFPVEAMVQQCRNGKFLLNNIKDIKVLSKVEVKAADFFRFYDLEDIGGKIVTTPEELLTREDRKRGGRFLTYVPNGGGAIYFSSYGKDGKTGRDIYRSEVMVSGGYSDPVKLAGYINTAQDEDFPVLAPDGKTFYFCSKGHNSMGGYDVFKSTYDAGMDVFSAPENMDFAVNTPANELLYIVGPGGEQACFASDRDSKQGMENVYRVSTTQAPINITVLKGTFASAFDPTDREARIKVEDALTREQVADVSTDMNGNYLLALPHGGDYKFLVTCGPNDRTLLEKVSVPNNDAPRAYRQEMKLVEQGGEKIVITNYFDSPLDEDVMALAMDEIRRRARLDVTDSTATGEPALAAATPDEDPLQAAGFDGTMTLSKAMDMARSDAKELEEQAKELEAQANTAFAMALKNVTKAEAGSKQASDLLEQAGEESDQQRKDGLMREAALARQRSAEANERARAAYRTAREMDSGRMGTQQRASTASALSTALAQAQASGDKPATTRYLKQLKARVDAKKGPDAAISEVERTRRAATEAAAVAARKMKQATAQRDEETALAERTSRLAREVAGAKGRKQEQLSEKLAVLEAQRKALHDEVEAAFTKAHNAEDEAALARGQAALVRYLKARPTTGDSAMPKEVLAQVEQRLADVRERNSGLAIDQRYDPSTSETAEARERRTFDWGREETLASAVSTTATVSGPEGASGGQQEANPDGSKPGATSTPKGDASTSISGNNRKGGPEQANTTTTESSGSATASGTSTNAQRAPKEDLAQAGDIDGNTKPENSGKPTSAGEEQEAGSERLSTGIKKAGMTGQDHGDAALNTVSSQHATADSKEREEQAFLLANKLSELEQLRKGTNDPGVRDSLDRAITEQQKRIEAFRESNGGAVAQALPNGQAEAGTGQEAAATGGHDGTPETGVNAALGGSTMTENEVRATRDSLGQELAATAENAGSSGATSNEAMASSQQAAEDGGTAKQDSLELEPLAAAPRTGASDAGTGKARAGNPEHGETINPTGQTEQDQGAHGQAEGTMPRQAQAQEEAGRTATEQGETTPPVQFKVMRFDLSTLDEQLAEEAYPGFAVQRKAIENGDGSPRDKANRVHALEMALIDSIDVRTAQTVAYLDEHPEEAGEVLPRLERWRQLKAAHAERADLALADVDQQYATTETRALEDAALSGEAIPSATPAQKQVPTPHNDAYVQVEPDFDKVYASPLEPRSTKDVEAVERQRKDLRDAEEIQAAIDSLEEVLRFTSAGKKYEKLRRSTDRKIDDLLIAKVDMGQRMSFITKSEYAVATDSAKVLERAVTRKGLAPDEPLVQMADSYQSAAKEAMAQGKKLRKQADRSNDILKRDSLYRQAYTKELRALRDLDRSHTVRNYLLSGQAVPGEALSYQEVERRLFPAATESLAAAGEEGRSTAKTTAAGQADAVDAAVPAGRAAGEEGAAQVRPEGEGVAVAITAPEGSSRATGKEAVADRSLLNGYLDRFYYLDPSERATVMNGPEESRYFLMKGRAMEERSDAEAARTEAKGSRKLAADLRGEANAIKNGQDASAERLDRAEKLDARANALMERSDSLGQVADRALAVAKVNEAQAATLMQGLPADRSAAIMDLEQGKRRTEPLLARMRPEPATAVPASGVDTSPALPNAPEPAPGTQEVAQATAMDSMPGTADRNAEGPVRMATNAPAVSRAPAPALAPLTRNVFSFTESAPPRTEAIPIDAPLPKGVVYKVQVGAFRKALPLDAFSDMTPLRGEHAGNGLVRYTAGLFTSAEGASEAGAKVRARGYRDAFVVAYIDGKRVPLRKAMQEEKLKVTQPAMVADLPAATSSDATPRSHAITASEPATETPATPAQRAQAAQEATVLAKYPATAQEVLAEFKPATTDYYNDPNAAPAKPVEVVKGLFFTVQVGVYSKPTPLDRLFNITPLNSQRTATDKIRYTTGIFLDEGRAKARRSVTVALGVTDAFVTAYLNGKRIPLRDARALLAKFGNAVLVDPALTTK